MEPLRSLLPPLLAGILLSLQLGTPPSATAATIERVSFADTVRAGDTQLELQGGLPAWRRGAALRDALSEGG